MKSILLLSSAIFFLLSCTKEPEQKLIDETGAFYINKVNETYVVYSNKGVLILEFTPENTDFETLETLNYIYETVKEFHNLEYEDKISNQLDTRTI